MSSSNVASTYETDSSAPASSQAPAAGAGASVKLKKALGGRGFDMQMSMVTPPAGPQAVAAAPVQAKTTNGASPATNVQRRAVQREPAPPAPGGAPPRPPP